MPATAYKQRTKKPTPLSTRSLAAFMTWKQFDLLLLLETEGIASASTLSGWVAEIQQYDSRHGGAFYAGTDYSSTYGTLRTLEGRRLVSSHWNNNGNRVWAITDRGRKAMDWLEEK